MDQRITKLAKLLVDYSIKVKKNDKIGIRGEPLATPLVQAVYIEVLKRGAIPHTEMTFPDQSYLFYKHATKNVLNAKPDWGIQYAKHCDKFVRIVAPENSKQLSNIDPKIFSARNRKMEAIRSIIMTKPWILFYYPTQGMAQDADMSLPEFEDFVFNASLIDWNKQSKRQAKLTKMLTAAKQVRIVGPNTDITFGVKGRGAINSDGHHNMPCGEVFIAPEENTTEGHIHYTFPCIWGGREVDNVQLTFKKGKIIKAKASKNEAFLKTVIKTDPGACKLGEFGIGTNFKINRFVRNILYDEKIGGTIHLAIGMAYKEGGGMNNSAVHWDMIKDLRKKGEIYFDGKLIQKNGKFTFKF